MPKRWSDEENQICKEILGDYRKAIYGEDAKTTTSITLIFARQLHHKNQILQERRTLNAVFEHLPYFDDLTAGVGEELWYAKKDLKYFSTIPRADGDIEINKTKRRPYHKRLK